MSTFEFLFGKKGRGQAPIGEKIKSSAKSKLESKIMRNPMNAWWAVLIRQWLIYPAIKLPLIPIREALHIKSKIAYFTRAAEVLKENGVSHIGTKHFPTLTDLRKVKSYRQILVLVGRVISAVFWKPMGHPLAAEKALSLKLLGLTVITWSLSMLFAAIGIYRLFADGVRWWWRDVLRLFRHMEIWDAYNLATSASFKFMLLGAATWLTSLTFCLLIANRKWLRNSEKIKNFLKSNNFNPDEIDHRCSVLALQELVYISTPSASVNRLRPLRNGWPDVFLPGEIFDNIKNPSEVVLLRRPPKEPLIFSGAHTNSDIESNFAAYEKGIIGTLTAKVKKLSDPENIFLGEVIDSLWWRSSQIYMPLSTNPHIVVVGQTRSGKSKGILSFVYSFARAYPDTVWYFADGKGSPDYDPFADFLSEYPVAKPDDKGDPLIQFANLVEVIWGEYNKRYRLFEEARLQGKPCSTIYQYRELVGPLPQVWFVIDEFSVFNMEMDFEINYKVAGTIANRLKRLSAEAASYGIHLLIASQRYQASDVPVVMRSNLTARMIYNVQMSDANFLGIEEATKLRTGQSFVSAAGLYCEHTGINIVKAKLPYIGDKPDRLLSKSLKPIARERKKQFDPYLAYNKGNFDLEDMTIPEFCVRLQKFFRDQNYDVEETGNDPEAVELQMHIIKIKKRKIENEDGTIGYEHEPVGDPPIGVSIIKSDELDEDSLLSIQDKYSNYPIIIVFVLGKNVSSQKYKFVKDLNEKGTRFFIYPAKDYKKDFRYVEMKRRMQVTIDLINSKLQRFGLTDVQHEVAARNISWEEITRKTPMRLRVAKIFDEFRLDTTMKDAEGVRGIPYVSTQLPGGAELKVLIIGEKNQRDDAKALAERIHDDGGCTILVTDEKITQTDMKHLQTIRAAIWRTSQIDEWVMQGKSGRLDKNFINDLVKTLGIVRNEGGDEIILYGAKAALTLNCELSPDRTAVRGLKIACATTNYALLSYGDIPLDQYRLDYLHIPETAKLVVTSGLAPLGARPQNVRLRLSAKGQVASLPPNSQWEVASPAILKKKESKIASDDPTLLEMLKLD